MNRNFGHLESSTKIVYADSVINDERGLITNPTAEDYAKCTPPELPVKPDSTPSPPEGYIVSGSHWEEQEGSLLRVWEYEEAPKVYRKFSKLKLYGAIAQLGAWDTIKAWLESKTVNGVNGWMAFQLAQEISEENELFTAWADEARNLLGLTEEQFETLLNQCVLEG